METPNLNYIKEISGGDLDFEASILEVLKKEFPVDCLIFEENFNKKSYEEASNNVHKIKHKISMLGLNEGLQLASKFENDLKKCEVKLYEKFVEILKKIHVYLG